MCGRFPRHVKSTRLEISRFRRNSSGYFAPRQTTHFNISPSSGPGHEQLNAMTAADGTRVLKLARWWFIPSTEIKQTSQSAANSFQRAHSRISVKSRSGGALSNRAAPECRRTRLARIRRFTRCKSEPYRFHMQRSLLRLRAGLWSTWQSPEGNDVDSFTIITTEANEIVKPIHDRMPLIAPADALGEPTPMPIQCLS